MLRGIGSMPCSAVPERAIGGVFEAQPAGAPVSGSLWATMTAGAASVLTFHNARSAFAHVLRSLAPRRVFLPAYCCTDLRAAVAAVSQAPVFYHSDVDLCPDIGALERALRPGDLVLGINHFGRPAQDLAALARARSDVIWVEDCAQSLAGSGWADLRIFSPRKWLGVADGGVLIDTQGTLSHPSQRPAASAALRHAGLLRRHDQADRDNARWFAAFRRTEARMQVSDYAMSADTLHILQATAFAPLANARRANYAQLYAALGDSALWSDPAPEWVPLGFALRCADAGALAARLARHRIFAPRHWQTLASDAPSQTERMLSGSLLTLPCDQRYGSRDMDRVIAAVSEAMA